MNTESISTPTDPNNLHDMHAQDKAGPEAGMHAITAIDTHAHVFARSLNLARQRRYTPDYDATLDDYLAQLDANGISHGVLVQPSFLGSDCSYMLDALAQAPERLRGVAVVDSACGAAYLDRLHRAGVVGIRLNMIGVPDLPLQNPAWSETLAQVAALGWHVEVHAEASRLPATIEPLLAHTMNIVIDHYGRPEPQANIGDASLRYLYGLADTGRVWIKLSGAYRNWGDLTLGAAQTRARGMLAALRERFGLERLMWGSDWPHTQFETRHDYRTSLDLIKSLLPDREVLEAVMVQTPARFFGFARNESI